MPDPAIGLIGVGLLGAALAERLRQSGFALLGYDPAPPRLAALAAVGGAAAASPQEVASRCPRILLCLPDSGVVRQVVEAMLPCLTPGGLLIDATTGNPEDAVELAALLRAKEVGHVEATLVGSSAQARAGQAQLLVAGADRELARAADLLAALSPHMLPMGATGQATRMKLVVNLVLGLNRAALAEGLSLARAAGLDPAATLAVLESGPAASAAMAAKGLKMLEGEFSPVARLAQHHKDVQLILRLALRHGARAPLSATHEQLLRRAIELGYGEADNSAVIRAWDP